MMEPIIKIGNAVKNVTWDQSDIKRFRKIRKKNGKKWKYFNLEQNPITYTRNSLGYRTHEFDFTKNYIIAFGCSNTYGSHLHQKDVFTNLIENETGIRTYNAGICGGSANMIMLNVASLLASGVKKPDAIIIQWPKIARLNLPYNIPEPNVKRIRIGENDKTENIFLDLVANNINPIHVHSEWSKNYVDYLLGHHNVKNIQFAVNTREAEFYDVEHILRIDTAADDQHCGTQTHVEMARYVIENL